MAFKDTSLYRILRDWLLKPTYDTGYVAPFTGKDIKLLRQALIDIGNKLDELEASGGGSGLNPDGSDVGATAQEQAFTNGVKTQEIKDSSNVSAIAVDARVLRDAAGSNNIDFSGVPLFLQGLKTSTITEEAAGAGITIIGTAGNFVFAQDVPNEAYIKIPQSTIDHACINLDVGADPTTPDEGDMWYDGADIGFSFQTEPALDHITLVVNEGWTLHTGTGSKAAFDADWTQSISAVPTQAEVESVRDQVIAVQKALAGIQDHLMTNMKLFQG